MASPDRPSGLPLVGDLAWGTHFCLFHQGREDLLDILVPFFRAGLESGELCVWVVSPPLEVAEVIEALRTAVAPFETHEAQGRIEVIPEQAWTELGGESGRAVVGKLDQAGQAGLGGLRLASSVRSLPGARARFVPRGLDAIAGNNVLAAFAYPRDRFDAVGLMEVVKDHRFALVRNAGRWQVIESAEARPVMDALRRTEEKLRFLFSNMSEGFAYHRIMLDELGRPCDYVFLEVNEAFEKITGLNARDIVGQAVTRVIPGIERDPADWIGMYGRTALTGEPTHFESYSELLQRWYAVSVFCPRRGHFAVIFSDITERKRAEERITALNEALRRHVEELSAANRELEAFTYTVSHDLRAPLRYVGNYVQLLESRCAGQLDERGRQYLEAIGRSSRHMSLLIDDLLAFSQTGRVAMAPQRLDCNRLVREVIQELRAERQAEDVSWDVRPLPEVFADPTLLHLVFANLIGNALKFTRLERHALIEVAARDEGAEHVFSVRDNGVGFDMQYAGKLFGLFQRLHRAEDFEGTGVGLANVARIVQRHGGRVWAEGAPGEGATIFFTLPKEREGR